MSFQIDIRCIFRAPRWTFLDIFYCSILNLFLVTSKSRENVRNFSLKMSGMSGKSSGSKFQWALCIFHLVSQAVILVKFAMRLSFLYMTFITLLTQLILREFGKNFGNPGVLKILDVSNLRRSSNFIIVRLKC